MLVRSKPKRRLKLFYDAPPNVSCPFRAVQMMGHDCKFVPADAGNKVTIPRYRREALPNGGEEVVTFGMAVHIVYFLEPIEVKHQNGVDFLWPKWSANRRLQGAFELAPGTLRSILKQAELSLEQLRNLL